MYYTLNYVIFYFSTFIVYFKQGIYVIFNDNFICAWHFMVYTFKKSINEIKTIKHLSYLFINSTKFGIPYFITIYYFSWILHLQYQAPGVIIFCEKKNPKTINHISIIILMKLFLMHLNLNQVLTKRWLHLRAIFHSCRQFRENYLI